MRLPLKSPTVAAWLWLAAVLVIAMVCIGGATRLTQSGLSITEWKPVSGTIPPQSDAAWTAEFENYKKIPQFRQINPNMTVEQFKGIYWWEWTHRLVARFLVGLVYTLPFIVFWLMRELPRRIIWRGLVSLGLIGFQALLGWWMVASGLTARLFVAPEMLMSHLGVALLLLVWTVWTALEAADGETRSRGAPLRWKVGAAVIAGLVFLQCLLGALVAGNQAGLIYNDWPLMNGSFAPPVSWSGGVFDTLFHDQGLVQFLHRMNAYLIFLYTFGFLVAVWTRCRDDGLRGWTAVVFAAVCVQVALGIATLVTVVNFWLALSHQLVAVTLLTLGTVLLWKIIRADRAFRSSSGF